MSVAERVAMWNCWYDAVPGEWRFQATLIWSLLVLGTINMALTVAVRFPFALLVLLGIIVITAISRSLCPLLGHLAHGRRCRLELSDRGGWLADRPQSPIRGITRIAMHVGLPLRCC